MSVIVSVRNVPRNRHIAAEPCFWATFHKYKNMLP